MHRLAVAFACLTLSFACATTPIYDREWLEVRTRHFEIVSSLGEEATLALVRDAELFYAATEFMMGTSLRPPGVPSRIYAFDGRGLLRPFAVRGASSTFRPSLREGSIVLRTGDGWSDATPVLRHELAHHLLRNQQGLDQSLWFDEGAAEFLSTVEMRGDSVELGRVREDSLRALGKQLWMPMIRVLKVRDLEGWGSRKLRSFRAESWALVHYLNLGPKAEGSGRAPLNDYFQSLADGTPDERSIREFFGLGAGELDSELRRYVEERRFAAVVMRLRNSEGALATRRLARDEVFARLGWLLSSLGRAKEARRYFEKGVAANPSNAHAHAGLAALEGLRGRWAAALEHQQRALSIAPEDALNQLNAGAHYYARAAAAEDAESRAGLAALARQHYARSLELEPSLPEAHAMYGATFLLDGEEVERALGPLLRASELLPSSLEIALRLAQLYARLERFSTARNLAVGVLSRTHSSVTTTAARELLAEIDSARSRRVRLEGEAREVEVR